MTDRWPGVLPCSLLLVPSAPFFAQTVVAVLIDAVDPVGNPITITFRETQRTMQIARTMRVRANEREAVVAHIRPGVTPQ
jgi:hypothetical protein